MAASAKFHLTRPQAKTLPDEQEPTAIFLLLYGDGKQVKLPTGESIHPAEWDAAEQRAKVGGRGRLKTSDRNAVLNATLARLQARVGAEMPVPAARPWWPRAVAAAALVGPVAGGLWNRSLREVPVAASRTATSHLAAVAPAAPAPMASPKPASDESGAPTYAAVAPRTSATQGTGPLSQRPAGRPSSGQVAPDLEELTEAAGNSEQATADDATNLAGAQGAAPVVAAKAQADARPSSPAADSLASVAGEVSAARFAKAKMAVLPDAMGEALRTAAPMPVAPAIAPAPVGGTPALREYLHRAAAAFIPETNQQRLAGTVRVRFVVGADDAVSGLRANYDAEALRLVCDGPAWRPGIARGRRAPLLLEVMVPF